MLLQRMACFSKASPALMELLDKLHSMENPRDMDHHLCEFGSVQYHVQASASDPRTIYLSISTPPLSPDVSLPKGLSGCSLQEIRRVYSDVIEVLDAPKEGFTLTVKIDLARLPQRKEDYSKMLTSMSSLQAVVLSSQLNDMFWNLGVNDISCGGCRPIQIVFHPREPFFVIRMVVNSREGRIGTRTWIGPSFDRLDWPIRSDPGRSRPIFILYYKMPEKFTVIFPMRFNEDSDVIIAASLFQELMEVSDSSACAIAPACTWSPIPPPELRGESLQSLSTNGGFVSFEIYSHHVKGQKMEKIIWILLNFYAFVRYYIKCNRGFIQRKMRQRLESFSEALEKARIGEDKDCENVQGCRCTKRPPNISKSRVLRRTCGALTRRIGGIFLPIRIQALARFRRPWLRIPKVSSLRKYSKLD